MDHALRHFFYALVLQWCILYRRLKEEPDNLFWDFQFAHHQLLVENVLCLIGLE